MDMETVRSTDRAGRPNRSRGLDSPAHPRDGLRSAPACASAPPSFGRSRRRFPTSCIVGCSTAGEMHQRHPGRRLADRRGGALRRRPARLGGRPRRVDRRLARAGERIGGELAAADLRAVFVLSDGLDGQRQRAGRRHHRARAPGGRGDRRAGRRRRGFASTWVLDRGMARSGMVTAVGIYGDRGRGGARHRRGLGEVRPRAGGHPLGGQRALRARRPARARALQGVPGPPGGRAAGHRPAVPAAGAARAATARPGWCARSSASTRMPSR